MNGRSGSTWARTSRTRALLSRTTPKSATDNAGVVDHIAFLATEPEKFAKRFEERGVKSRNRSPRVPALPDVRQGPERAHRRAELLRHGQGAGGARAPKAAEMVRVPETVDERASRAGVRELLGRRLRRGARAGACARAHPARARSARRGRAEDFARDRGRPTAPDSSTSPSRSATAAWSSTSCRSSTFRPSSRAAAPPSPGTSATWASTTGCSRSTTARAQDEVWGANPDALIASGIAFPQGRARKVDGGFSLSGHYWNFSSGVDPSEWNMLAAQVYDGDRSPAGACAWYTLRVRDRRRLERARHARDRLEVGAGEGRVRAGVQGARHDALPRRASAGRAPIQNPLYQIPITTLGSHCLAGAALGGAQAALELTCEAVKARSTNYTGMRMRDFQTVQLRVGAAGARSRRRACCSAVTASQRDRRRRPAASWTSRRSSGSSATSPMRRALRGRSTSCTRCRRERHLRRLSDPAHLPRRPLARRPHRVRVRRAWLQLGPGRSRQRHLSPTL